MAAVALLVLGCGERSAETTQAPESSGVEGQDAAPAPQVSEPEAAKTAGAAVHDDVDPRIKDFVYPGSEAGGQFDMGGTVSLQYASQDDYAKVVDHYLQKFPGSHPGAGTSAYFAKQNADGSNLTVTVTKLDTGTQIILKLEEAR
jgi:hypothetical protein